MIFSYIRNFSVFEYCTFRTLAGSTIMLLTLPWLGSIILGRVDIVNKQGKDGVTTKFTVNSFVKQVGNKDLCSVIGGSSVSLHFEIDFSYVACTCVTTCSFMWLCYKRE